MMLEHEPCMDRAGLDLDSLVYQLTGQIPLGMVSTYGDIAAALGDPVAARTVGEALSRNPQPIVVPCHRVVYSTGRTGWYGGHGKGAAMKIELLQAEGVEVVDGKVQKMDDVRFTAFRTEPVLRTLREEQMTMRSRVIEQDNCSSIQRVAGLDVSYKDDRAYGAMAVYDLRSGEMIEERTFQTPVRFPYIPTYLFYRELPALKPLVVQDEDVVYLVDGHGVLHPRGAGLASQLGVELDVATIGAAKSLLVGRVAEVMEEKAPIMLDGEVKGYRLGTGKRCTFVSVGHRVSLSTAVSICQPLMRKGVPLPLQRAHELAGEARRMSG